MPEQGRGRSRGIRLGHLLGNARNKGRLAQVQSVQRALTSLLKGLGKEKQQSLGVFWRFVASDRRRHDDDDIVEPSDDHFWVSLNICSWKPITQVLTRWHYHGPEGSSANGPAHPYTLELGSKICILIGSHLVVDNSLSGQLCERMIVRGLSWKAYLLTTDETPLPVKVPLCNKVVVNEAEGIDLAPSGLC